MTGPKVELKGRQNYDVLYIKPEHKASQIAPESQEEASQAPPLRSHAVSQTVKDITERMLRLEIHRAIQDLGPQKTAQVIAQTFRLKGLPKELRRHL